MNLFEVKKILKQEKISPLKRFGQNFLIDSNIARKFVSTLDLDEKDTVVEIGPGLGAISSIVLRSGCSLIAYEIDRKFSELLKKRFSSFNNFNLVEGDFLKAPASLFQNETAGGKTAGGKNKVKIKIISNLPYYLTSSIIISLIKNRDKISQAVLIMQKEVAEKIIAVYGTPDYGALSVKVQFYCKLKKLFDINRNAFYPRPDVISTAMKFELLDKPKYKVENSVLFENVLKGGFAHRRKQFRKAIAEILGNNERALKVMREAKVNPAARIEELSIDKIVELSNVINSELKGRK